MKDIEPINLPFDQYSRQQIVKSAIDRLRSGKQSFTILDVGGYKGVTSRLHSLDKTLVLDVFDVKEQNYVKGDARKMNFPDSSFDFVVSFDALEHIPKNDRKKVLEECIRVAKRGVMITSPANVGVNSLAEKQLNNLYERLHGTDHPWLKEHIEYGLPKSEEVEAILRNRRLYTKVVGSNNLRLWLLMQGAIFTATKYPEALNLLDKLNKNYNTSLVNDASIDAEKNYRHITFGFMDKRDLAKAFPSNNKGPSYVTEAEETEMATGIITYFNDVIGQYAKVNNQLRVDSEGQAKEIDKLMTEIAYLQKRIKIFEKIGLFWLGDKTRKAYRRVIRRTKSKPNT